MVIPDCLLKNLPTISCSTITESMATTRTFTTATARLAPNSGALYTSRTLYSVASKPWTPSSFALRYESLLTRRFATSQHLRDTINQQSSKKTPSRHVVYYRDFLPPTIRILLWSSIVYVGLHLLALNLEYQEYRIEAEGKIKELEQRVHDLHRDKVSTVASESTESSVSSWLSWLGGKKASA